MDEAAHIKVILGCLGPSGDMYSYCITWTKLVSCATVLQSGKSLDFGLQHAVCQKHFSLAYLLIVSLQAGLENSELAFS